MVPSPITAAVCPAARPLRSTACIPTANGSTRQPCSKLTVGGRAYKVRAFTAMYWAMAPFLRYSVQATPTMRRCAQRLCIPWVQNQQQPQYSVESKVTRSPTAQLCTASPSCAMVPLASWPMTSGRDAPPVLTAAAVHIAATDGAGLYLHQHLVRCRFRAGNILVFKGMRCGEHQCFHHVYHSATLPSSCLQTGFFQLCGVWPSSSTRALFTSTPRPGFWGRLTKPFTNLKSSGFSA